MKCCCTCGETKPLSEFWKHKQKEDGLDPRCRTCARKHKKDSNEKRKAALGAKVWRKKREGYAKTYKRKFPERVRIGERRRLLRRKFGLTLDEYNEKLISQNGKCAICRKKPLKIHLAVDHDKETGQIRGLLCSNCNTGIGLLFHSQRLLSKSIEYLKIYE